MAATFEMHPVQRPGRPVSVVHRPSSLEAALRLLAQDPTRRPLAGGTDILLDLQRGGPGPAVELIDLTAVEDFASITEAAGTLQLGGGVTHNQLVSYPNAITKITPLAQACLEIGSPQLRNRATIAGNLATASPANDTLSALLVLDASLELARWNGDAVEARTLALADFFTGFRETTLADDELIVRIDVPILGDDQRGIWVKLGNRRAQAISVIHAGFVLTGDGEIVTEARLAFGSVAATVTLSAGGAAALIGSPLDGPAIAMAASAVAAQFDPIDDDRATAEYRKELLSTLVVRSLEALRDDRHLAQWPQSRPLLSTPAPMGSDPMGRGSDPMQAVDNSHAIEVTVNGDLVVGGLAARLTLLDWLRQSAGVEGTKEGCAEGECGACTVQLNGQAVMSCLVSAAQADGGTVVTVEGLAGEDGLHPIQQAFIDEFAVQCGFCIPGFLVASASLLDETETPTDDEIKLGLSGNLCRCTGYYPMITAVKIASGQQGQQR